MTNDSNNKYYQLLGLLILIYLVVFLKLDSFHMRWWDESMFAVNAYEMMHNGKYFSLYFDGLPDLLNTKPPLSIWTQILFINLLGYNELAIRLPSAIAAGLAIILIFKFVSNYFNNLLAWLSALILLTSYGFINFHTSRTGDSDSLLCLFLIVANIYFLRYIMDGTKKYIFLFLLFISLAFAIKLFAALLFSPAYLIILIQNKKTNEFILSKYFISGIILFVFTSFGLIYLRELDTPGYIHQIIFNDAGRMFNLMQNHMGPPTFYMDNFVATRFSIWFVLLVVGAVLSFFAENKPEKKLLVNLIILSLIYLIIISSSITKLEWYDMPLYPFFSVIAAYPLFLLLNKLNATSYPASQKRIMVLVFILFLFPYYTMFNKSQGNSIQNGEKILEANERYIFKRNTENKNLNGIKVYYTGWNRSLFFYKYKLAELGQKIELTNTDQFNLNDKVLVSNESLIIQLQKKYVYSVIDSLDKSQLIQINQVLK